MEPACIVAPVECCRYAPHSGRSALADIPAIADRARQLGRTLHDVRQTPRRPEVGNGLKRTGKRMLMVGADCVVGKKYTALALARAMKARGMAR